MSLLGKDWNPALTIEKFLLALLPFLDEPDVNDPLRPEAAEVYVTSKEDYELKAQETSKPYAV
ncbi:hypothetical protein GCM10010502_68710 [Kitasatospora aureofaciens]|nr:hypothetical protein GCM10010502_68710 [Kitasatospora aureofaciens]